MAAVEQMTHPGWYIGLTFIMALLPLILGTTTSYLKISLALGVLRNGFGAQQVPSNTIILVLSFVLSIFIMQPVAEKIFIKIQGLPVPSAQTLPKKEHIEQYLDALNPWKEFLTTQSGAKEIGILKSIATTQSAKLNQSQEAEIGSVLPTRILIPAFVLTELKEGLMIGFVLLLPFLVIDLVIANILAGLGMYMMSPTIISLPLKLLLFVSVDGWLLISRGFIASYS